MIKEAIAFVEKFEVDQTQQAIKENWKGKKFFIVNTEKNDGETDFELIENDDSIKLWIEKNSHYNSIFENLNSYILPNAINKAIGSTSGLGTYCFFAFRLSQKNLERFREKIEKTRFSDERDNEIQIKRIHGILTERIPQITQKTNNVFRYLDYYLVINTKNEKFKKTIIETPEKKVFYLKVPTGGGKTNISLKLVLTLLENKKDIKKVFCVFPFINIIEQNYSVIKDTLGLKDEISPIYSTSSWNLDSEKKEEQLRYVLDNEFLNFPFVVMSNVNFFNTFIKSGKSSNYRLLNLANSIVILDEIQSLNDKDWTVFNDFITFGSKALNIHFIIMSATLPNLEDISLETFSDKSINLIKDYKNYFLHPLFSNRVKFEYKENVQGLYQIIDLLKEEINKANPNKILVVVNTIEDSRELYNEINNDDFVSKGYSVSLLNSTILPHRRKEIIDGVKKEKSKIIFISTQSVEAGVDIDCDFGIRDFAIFDSIEQIAGRINRNFKNLDPSKLIIINLKKDDTQKAFHVYKGTHRWNTIQDHYKSPNEIKKFLELRDFDVFYNKVIENINLRNNHKFKEASLDIVKKGIRELNFPKLNEMNVIDQKTISFFVNVDIPKIEFTEEEIKFILKRGIIFENKISGKDIWESYKNFNKDFKKGIIDRMINTKIWSSILSKFIISVLDYCIDGEKLSKRLNLSDGIVFLKEGYSIEEGINPKTLSPEWVNSFEDFFV